MIRWLLWAFAGLVLGGVIHIAVILGLPSLTSTVAWDQVATLGAAPGPVVLPAIKSGAPNPLRLDPELTYAVCQLDLRKGPATVAGTLPQSFWSVAVYNRTGAVIYSTTNRDGLGTSLDVGLFDAAQTRLLAEQKLDVADGLLIVEASDDDVLVVVRLAPPQPVMRPRYEKALAALKCGNIPT